MMNLRLFGLSMASVAVGIAATVHGQGDLKTVDAHVKAAEAAAGQEYRPLFTQLCAAPAPTPARQGQPPARGSGEVQQGPPDRSTWYAEPVKVFDNLYFLGQSEYSVWAVTTSQGIILVDTIFGYSVEAEVVDGMRKLGLDPTQIKYAILSHGHSDHSGGAKYLQERFGTRILVSEADWSLLERSAEPKPKRDIVITDGMKLTLGDTTLTMYLTPGHTQGTVSTIIPVRDNGTPHVAAVWGGTLFNWLRGGAAYITPSTPSSYWFENYIASARTFRAVAAKSGADILLSNHTQFDGSKTRLPAVRARKPGAPHPYVVGNASVTRFLTMAEECAKAGLLRTRQ